ncbi:hypothetical protein J0A71_01g00060 [Encephalitozoon cuniculi]|nr:hypothetical protein J0A71_01g00060 [Encephalitozoon cuniculi]
MPCPEDGNPPEIRAVQTIQAHHLKSILLHSSNLTTHNPQTPILIRRTPISCPYPMTSSRPPTAILVPLLVQSDRRSHNSTSMPPSNLQHSRHSPPSILRNPTRQPPQRTHTSIKTTPSLSPLRTSSTPAISSNSSAPSSQKETDLQIRASDLQLPRDPGSSTGEEPLLQAPPPLLSYPSASVFRHPLPPPRAPKQLLHTSPFGYTATLSPYTFRPLEPNTICLID